MTCYAIDTCLEPMPLCARTAEQEKLYDDYCKNWAKENEGKLWEDETSRRYRLYSRPPKGGATIYLPPGNA